MELGLRGKVALVTGGSEGIGRATALRLAQEGARVAIAARRPDVLEAAATAIRAATGGDVLAIPTDVSQPEEIRRFVETTAEQFGRIDVLVNNAGRSFARSFEEVSDDDWQADLDLKFMAAVRAARLIVPHMRRVGEAGEVANLIAFLASDCAAYTTGTAINVDGGTAAVV